MAESVAQDWVESPERISRRRRKAPIAAFWSFVFPGGGQLYNHQKGLALALALPILLLAAVVVAAVLTLGESLLPRLLDTRVVMVLIGVDAALLLWRIGSMLHAHRFRARFRVGRLGTWVTAFLVVLAFAMHAVPAYYGFKLVETMSAVALGGERAPSAPDTPPVAGIGGSDGEPLPRPSAIPNVDRGERVNILLVGVDSGVGRDHALTDTMLVVSLDPDGRPVMLSVPRDLVNAPLPDGSSYPFKLNSLLQVANADPAAYPLGGVGTLKATIGNLLGVPIHYLAAADMAGFRHVIDAIGGVVVDVFPAVADPQHDLYLDPGPVFMDGTLALTYVRSRYGPGNDDFVRAGRQQQVLTAVASQLTAGNLLLSFPTVLDAVQATVATDVPADRIPELAQAIQETDLAAVERDVIQPPNFVTPATGADGAYILIPDLDAIRALGQELLSE